MLATGTGTDRIPRRTDDRAGRFSFPVARDADALANRRCSALEHAERARHDLARHLAYARMMLPELWSEAGWFERRLISA